MRILQAKSYMHYCWFKK